MKHIITTFVIMFIMTFSVFSQNSQIATLVKAIEADYNKDYGYETTVDYDYQSNTLHVKNKYCEFWFKVLSLSSVTREGTAQLVFNSSSNDITGTCGSAGHNREFFNFKTGSVVDNIAANVMKIKALAQGGGSNRDPYIILPAAPKY